MTTTSVTAYPQNSSKAEYLAVYEESFVSSSRKVIGRRWCTFIHNVVVIVPGVIVHHVEETAYRQKSVSAVKQQHETLPPINEDGAGPGSLDKSSLSTNRFKSLHVNQVPAKIARDCRIPAAARAMSQVTCGRKVVVD